MLISANKVFSPLVPWSPFEGCCSGRHEEACIPLPQHRYLRKILTSRDHLLDFPEKEKKRKEVVNSPLDSKCFAASYNGSKRCDSNG